MVIRNVTVNDCTPETIVIGRRGTFETMQVVFYLTYLIENYGDGTAVLALKRSQDSSAYPAVAAQDGNTLTWVVSEVDTYYVGAGVCQLMWYVNDGLAKTIIYPMVVMKDILSTAEDPPDGYENWIEHLTDLGAETLQNAHDAAQSASDAESAKDDAVTAKEAAEEAAETAQEAVVHAPIIQNGYWYIWNDGQYVDTGVRAEGQKGDKGDTGEKGDTGNGIASITKTGTSGLVDTYTVTYTDGTDTTFTVTNGAKGDKGDTGATGNGIQSITKTGTSGNVDTYTITYTNGQTTTFTVTNGAVSSVAGKTGAVTLDANDVAFYESGTYDDGTVGKELSNQKNAISQKAPVIINTASGDVASFADGADDMPIKSLVASIEPVQAGSGDPSPTNVRPISGHTGLTVARTGKNLFRAVDGDYTGAVPNTTLVCADGIYTLANSSPYPLGVTSLITDNRTALALGDNRFVKPGIYAFSLETTNLVGTTAVNTARLVLTNDVTGAEIIIVSGQSATINDPATITEIRCILEGGFPENASISYRVQLERSSAVTEYEQYTETIIPVTFPTTIYGGSDGVIGGALIDTHQKQVLDGDRAYSSFSERTNTCRVYLTLENDMKAYSGSEINIMADSLPVYRPDYVYSNDIEGLSQNNNSSQDQSGMWISVLKSRLSSVSLDGVKEYFRNNPCEFLFIRVTPIEYTLAANELNTLYGTNNVWTDVGEVSVDYPADTKLYIDGLTAPDEDMIADANIASGKYFVVNNQLYLSTAAIAAGASIVPGTNCTATNLAEALNALNT